MVLPCSFTRSHFELTHVHWAAERSPRELTWMKMTRLGLFAVGWISSWVRFPRLMCQTVTDVCRGIGSGAAGMGQEMPGEGMDCFSRRCSNGFSATVKLWRCEPLAESLPQPFHAYSCYVCVHRLPFMWRTLLSVNWDSCLRTSLLKDQYGGTAIEAEATNFFII